MLSYAMGSVGSRGEGAAWGPRGKERRALHSRALQGGNETGHPLCPQRPPAGAPRLPSPGRGSWLRALRQMLHNADPPPPLREMAWSPRCSGKWAGAQGSAAGRGGLGRGSSRIPDVAERERGVQMLARRLPAPPPQTAAVQITIVHNSAELAMGRGNRVGAGHQNAPRGSPGRPGPTWAVVAPEADGRPRSALAARAPSCARHGRHTASWGVGPPESVTVVLPDQAAFCSLHCCLGF